LTSIDGACSAREPLVLGMVGVKRKGVEEIKCVVRSRGPEVSQPGLNTFSKISNPHYKRPSVYQMDAAKSQKKTLH